MFHHNTLLTVLAVLGIVTVCFGARGDPLFCPQDFMVDQGFKNKKFTDDIVRCLMDEKICEGEIENKIKSK